MVKPHSASARRYGWYVACILMLVNGLSYLDRQVMSILVTPIKIELGFTDTQVGLLIGPAFMLLFVFAGMPFGWLADKYHRAVMLTVAVLVWSLGTLFMGIADSFWSMFFARATIGLGEAAVVPAAFSLITDYFEPHRRARATSLVTIGIPLGSGAALFGGGLLLRWAEQLRGVSLPLIGERAPWQIVLVVFALLGVAVSLLVLTIKEPRLPAAPHRTAVKHPDAGARSFAGFLREHPAALTLIMLPYILLTYIQVAISAWAPTLLTRRYGLDPATAATLLGLVLITGPVAAAMLGGVIADWLAKRRAAGPFLLVTILGPLFLPGILLFTLGGSSAVAVIGLIVITGLGGVCSTTVYAALQTVVPPEVRGRMLALYALLAQIAGVGAAPPIVAILSDRLFGIAGLNLSLLFATAPAWLVIAICGIAGVKPFARLRRLLDEK